MVIIWEMEKTPWGFARYLWKRDTVKELWIVLPRKRRSEVQTDLCNLVITAELPGKQALLLLAAHSHP